MVVCTVGGRAVGSLHDDEPMQADEPPIVRGDAPRGLFTPRWEELQQTYGIERPREKLCKHSFWEVYICT